MATSVATAAGAPGAPPPPTRQEHQSGAGLLLVLAGLGAAGAAAWLLTHRKAAPATSGRYIAGSANPSLVTPAGRGLPGPEMIPCYGQVSPYMNQGVTTTIGVGPLGPAKGIPWGQPLNQSGAVIDAPWPVHPGVAGTGEWIHTDFGGCLASLADVTAA